MAPRSSSSAKATHAPFGEDAGLDRHRLERWPVEFFEELPTRAAEPADWPLCPPSGLKPHTDILKEFPYICTPHQK